MSFTPARPIGCRAQGQRDVELDWAPACRPEMEALRENKLDPRLSPAVHTLVWSRLRELVQLLRKGQVMFDGRDPGASVIQKGDCIYELRPRPAGILMSSREVRLYCGEPVIAAELAVGLHLATKPSGAPDEAGEQNAAIEVAIRRGEQWELDYARSKGER